MNLSTVSFSFCILGPLLEEFDSLFMSKYTRIFWFEEERAISSRGYEHPIKEPLRNGELRKRQLKRGNFMVQYCPMVKGLCRGKSCDFWARIKIRKLSLDELIVGIKESLVECNSDNSMPIERAIRDYWTKLGIKNMDRVCEEEPDLCTKMMDAEVMAKNLIVLV